MITTGKRLKMAVVCRCCQRSFTMNRKVAQKILELHNPRYPRCPGCDTRAKRLVASAIAIYRYLGTRADSWRLSLTTVERPISVTKYRHDLVWSRRGKEAEHVSGQG